MLRTLALTVITVTTLTGCGTSSDASDGGPITLRLGYFPNLTHAPALIGLKQGFFATALGPNVTIQPHTFNAGGDAVTALLSGSIDAAFAGPGPAVNAYVQSHGKAVRVVSGATSGGALLVVRPGIASAADLRGRKIADPELGGTQDIALRWYLKQQGFQVSVTGGGDVSVVPENNAATLNAFKAGQIDGAWVPEPWASRLVVEGGGNVLMDERDLWPDGRFATANLIVSRQFLEAHPNRTKALIEGLYQAIEYIKMSADAAQPIANAAIADVTGRKLAAAVVVTAWPHMTFTLDPLEATVKTSADHAHGLGLLADADVAALFDLRLLNQVLSEHGQAAVS